MHPELESKLNIAISISGLIKVLGDNPFAGLSLGSSLQSTACFIGCILVVLFSNSVLRSLTLLKHKTSFTEAECLGCHKAVTEILDLEKCDFNTPELTCLHF